MDRWYRLICLLFGHDFRVTKNIMTDWGYETLHVCERCGQCFWRAG